MKGSFGDADWKPPDLQLRPDFTTVCKGINCRSVPAQDDANSSDNPEEEGTAQPAWNYS